MKTNSHTPFDSPLLKCLSLVSACILWSIAQEYVIIQKQISIPVVLYNTNNDKAVDITPSISVTFEGTQKSIATLTKEPVAFYVNAQTLHKKQDWIAPSYKNITIPNNIKIVSCYPAMIAVTLHTNDNPLIQSS